MRIEIIGDGSAGQRHAQMLRERRHDTRIRGPKDSPQKSDAVVIASPPEWHRTHLAEEVARGCHILCEGPQTIGGEYYLPTRHTKIWMMASNWRFVPKLQAIKADPRLPLMAHFWFNHNLDKWRPGFDKTKSCYYWSGHDMINVHEVDLAFWLFGPAADVHIHKLYTKKTRACDGFSILIRHHSGVLTTIQSSWHSCYYTRGYRLYYEDGQTLIETFLSPEDDHMVNQSYEDMIDHWLKHIEEDNPLIEPNLEDGYRAYMALQGVAL